MNPFAQCGDLVSKNYDLIALYKWLRLKKRLKDRQEAAHGNGYDSRFTPFELTF